MGFWYRVRGVRWDSHLCRGIDCRNQIAAVRSTGSESGIGVRCHDGVQWISVGRLFLAEYTNMSCGVNCTTLFSGGWLRRSQHTAFDFLDFLPSC